MTTIGSETATHSERPSPVWWTSLLGGAVGLGVVALFTSHEREIESAWQLLVKIGTFVLLAVAIAYFPNRRAPHWLLCVPFLLLCGYLLPRISWFYYGDVARAQDDSFYTHLYLLLYPGVVLTVAAAHRIGGGTPGNCLKIVGSGMVIVFSGFLDVMWQVVNPVPIPEFIDAPHITIITGGPITFGATILFTLAHLPLLVAVNLLPLDRWLPPATRPRPGPPGASGAREAAGAPRG